MKTKMRYSDFLDLMLTTPRASNNTFPWTITLQRWRQAKRKYISHLVNHMMLQWSLHFMNHSRILMFLFWYLLISLMSFVSHLQQIIKDINSSILSKYPLMRLERSLELMVAMMLIKVDSQKKMLPTFACGLKTPSQAKLLKFNFQEDSRAHLLF